MKRLGGEIALTTIGAAYHWNIFDDKQIFAFAVCFCYFTDSCDFFSADVTYQRLLIFLHGENEAGEIKVL